MKNKDILYVLLLILVPLLTSVQAFALDSKDMVRLKTAGISEETIQTIIDEKVIETCAFTVQEILDLKKAGISDEAICKIIKKGSFMKDTAPVVYGNNASSIKSMSTKDIIELKNAGVSDDVIKSILSGSMNRDDEEHRRVWNMLENMGLIVDFKNE